MRQAPDVFAATVRSGGPLTLRVSSWLSGQRLSMPDGSDRLPVVARSWEISDVADARTSGELSFEVPNLPELWPTSPTHPLAAYGQRLYAQIGYGSERIPAGWFRILADPEDAGQTMRVRAVGLSHEIDRARFLRPYQTPWGIERLTILQRLVAPMPVVMDAGISNNILPVSTWDEDRLQAVIDIVDTWPARWYIGDDAALHIAPVWDDEQPGDPVAELTGGPGGGLVQLVPKQQVEDPPNAYRVANVSEGDTPEVVGTWTVPWGPMRWQEPNGMPGPYGQKPAYYASALLPADETKLVDVARNMTMRGLRRKVTASGTIAPDPRLQIGDIVMVASSRVGVAGLGRLTGYRITADAMGVDVAMIGDLQ